jgi:hypothetical protein
MKIESCERSDHISFLLLLNRYRCGHRHSGAPGDALARIVSMGLSFRPSQRLIAFSCWSRPPALSRRKPGWSPGAARHRPRSLPVLPRLGRHAPHPRYSPGLSPALEARRQPPCAQHRAPPQHRRRPRWFPKCILDVLSNPKEGSRGDANAGLQGDILAIAAVGGTEAPNYSAMAAGVRPMGGIDRDPKITRAAVGRVDAASELDRSPDVDSMATGSRASWGVEIGPDTRVWREDEMRAEFRLDVAIIRYIHLPQMRCPSSCSGAQSSLGTGVSGARDSAQMQTVMRLRRHNWPWHKKMLCIWDRCVRWQ